MTYEEYVEKLLELNDQCDKEIRIFSEANSAWYQREKDKLTEEFFNDK
jgi:hypothetical protein